MQLTISTLKTLETVTPTSSNHVYGNDIGLPKNSAPANEFVLVTLEGTFMFALKIASLPRIHKSSGSDTSFLKELLYSMLAMPSYVKSLELPW